MRIELSNITDEGYLVKCCKNNEPNAQHILYNKYVEDMMILCLRYIPNTEDAREALMDGFLNFFRNMSTFTYQGNGSVKAWLKQIVVNQCLMHLRKRTPFKAADNDIERYEHRETDDSVLDQLAAKELLHMLHTLPDGYRMIFNLYVFEGMNHREIGTMLGISEGTSKSQLHRARAMMKEKINVAMR